MSDRGQDRAERRVLVLAPTARDAALTESILERGAGIACVICTSLDSLCRELECGAAAVLLVEESVGPGRSDRLSEWLRRQPPWSDLPVLVLARSGADSAAVAQAMDLLGNVTVLERPMRVAALVSAGRTALRARERQYQARAHLDELQRAAQALRDADRRKDEFLAVLAHELRNPLAPIRNAVQILRLTSGQNQGAYGVGEIMERQVNHMVRLVDDLLEVSRVTRGKIELRKARIDVATVVRSAIETSRPLLESAGHSLEVTLAEAPLVLEGDPVRLTQVVANLLNNAAKYTPAGGRIAVRAWEERGCAMVSVLDTGIGIPPHELPGVFEPFAQIDRHASRAQGGLGIGLTLVKQLVELHGGSVRAHSPGEGRGSEFVIRLPLAGESPADRAPGQAASPNVALRARRVLVVDDNRDAADSLAGLLQLLGADARATYNGPDALAAIALEKPAAVLLDIGMPGMNGHEVARQIRRQPALADVTLIALTGWGQEQDRRRTRDAGFDFHLVKPPDLVALQTLLASLDTDAPSEVAPGGLSQHDARPATRRGAGVPRTTPED